MAMVEDRKEDQWWDLGVEEPEATKEENEHKTSSAWWWIGFVMIPFLVVGSDIIVNSDLGINPGLFVISIWAMVPSALFAKANPAQRESLGKGIGALLFGIVTMPLMLIFTVG